MIVVEVESWDEPGGYVRKRVTRHDGDYELIVFEGADGIDRLDDNVDAEVRFRDGSRWGATFYTLANIEALLEEWRRTGEEGGGLYFCAPTGTIIVQELDRETIEEAIERLLDDGEFRIAFEHFEDDG